MPSARKLIPALFVVLWSTGFIGARYAMPWAEPFTFLAARFGLAFMLLAPIAFVIGAWRMSRRDVFYSLMAGALMHGIYLGGVFWAVREGLTAGLSALIVGLQPLITAILAGLFLGEEILPRHWAGLAAGFVGVVVVILPKLGAGLDAVTWPMLAAALFAVAGMSAGTVLQKKFGAARNLVMGTAWQYVGATVLMAAGSLALETRTVVLSGELIFAMVWLVLVLSIGAIFLLMILIREGEMAKVSSLFYLVPAVTAVMAWFLFGESLTWVQIAGMALATFGVGLATSPARR
ncbi:DMT family transporter [Mesorhizobium sp. LHD-90]|uniref:DMT family transporter n=1 Tax=Mesorhizobium sp. LHD-90 TaxID=3071414 RepID=UPI0027E0A586|nr:DMT family transporter [Mesorhizobium sp. LHD-90]MDQ6432679.1 DMT family transporter [Mesorhizobium sp. LHD-90]